MSEQEDRILEDLLRRRRESGPPLGGPLCGDPELLAAFAEDALAGQPRLDMERHLAACAPCREAVARLVRLAPREATPATPAPAPAFWKRWAWAAPALAGMVLVGSFVWYNRERIVEQPGVKEIQAPPANVPPAADREEAAKKPATPAAEPAPERRAKKPREGSFDKVAGGGSGAGSGGGVAGGVVSPAPSPTAGPFAPQPPVKSDIAVAQEQAKLADKQVADELKAAKNERQQVQLQKQQQPLSPSQQAAAAVQNAPAPPPPPDRQRLRDDAVRADKVQAEKESGAVGGGKPGAMMRVEPGVVGAAETAAKPANSVFDARSDKDKKKASILRMPGGAKVSRTARFKDSDQAWALLTDGRLLVTQDAGENWKGVMLPERAVSVAAPEAGVGEITCASGRVYRSTDGGASWKFTSLR